MRGRWRKRRGKDETRPFHWNGTKGDGHSVGWNPNRYTSWQNFPLCRCKEQRLLYSLVVQRYLIYIFIIFVDNDESWQSYNRRLFARVPTILTPNYLIRVRVRARRIFPTQWKGGKARGGEVIADGSGLGLARGSVVRRYRVVWSPEDRMIAVWKRKEKMLSPANGGSSSASGKIRARLCYGRERCKRRPQSRMLLDNEREDA